jgi:tRNA nucleotidyltransferase/poly(A) polymerase
MFFLHYHRFYGRIAEQPDNHDEGTLRAIGENLTGLEKISGERIWLELRKILEGRFAGDLVKTMVSLGVSPYIGMLIFDN